MSARLPIGIDPGLSGGLVLLGPHGTVWDSRRMPTCKVLGMATPTRYNYEALADLLDSLRELARPRGVVVTLEKVDTIVNRSKRGQAHHNTHATMVLAHCVGAVRLWCGLRRVELHEVADNTWQSDLGIARGKGVDTKAQAKALAALTWADAAEQPDGVVDAYLLAKHGQSREVIAAAMRGVA